MPQVENDWREVSGFRVFECKGAQNELDDGVRQTFSSAEKNRPVLRPHRMRRGCWLPAGRALATSFPRTHTPTHSRPALRIRKSSVALRDVASAKPPRPPSCGFFARLRRSPAPARSPPFVRPLPPARAAADALHQDAGVVLLQRRRTKGRLPSRTPGAVLPAIWLMLLFFTYVNYNKVHCH